MHEAGVPTSLQLRKLPGAWWRYPPVTLVLTCMEKLSSLPESDMESLNTHPGGNFNFKFYQIVYAQPADAEKDSHFWTVHYMKTFFFP